MSDCENCKIAQMLINIIKYEGEQIDKQIERINKSNEDLLE